MTEYLGQSGAEGEGPMLRLLLDVDDQRITSASYETYPCPNAHRCGSWLARFAVGRTPAQVLQVTAADLTLLVGGLPPALSARWLLAPVRPVADRPWSKERCAQLAIEAMAAALAVEAG